MRNCEIETIKNLTDHISYLETDRLAQEKAKDLFECVDFPNSNPNATTNLVGEFDLEVEKFRGNQQLYALLLKYKEVFGPVPPSKGSLPPGANGFDPEN